MCRLSVVPPPAPLLPSSPRLPCCRQVHWYRLVLDEAQQVGGSLSHVAVMAGRIQAEHRCGRRGRRGKGGRRGRKGEEGGYMH